MSEKVKLTREQAEAIEELLKLRTKESIAREKANPFALISPYINDSSRLVFKDMAFDTLIKALYIGYEVEETFEVGDAVVLRSGQVVEITEEGSDPCKVVIGWIANGSMYRDEVRISFIARHATEQEKWWAKHGRKPLELKINDVLLRNDGAYVSVFHVDESQEQYELIFRGEYQSGYEVDKEKINAFYKVICFAEDRKDVGHAE